MRFIFLFYIKYLIRSNSKGSLGLKDLLVAPDLKLNLFGKTYLEEILEKAAIWDVLIDPFKPCFNNGFALIQKYLDQKDYPTMTEQEIEEDKKRVFQINQKKELFNSVKEKRIISYAEKQDELQNLYLNLFLEHQKSFVKEFKSGEDNLKEVYIKKSLVK